MPQILKIEHKDGQRTAVWEVEEDEFTLLEKALTPLISPDPRCPCLNN